eukprot:gene5333-12928_t
MSSARLDDALLRELKPLILWGKKFKAENARDPSDAEYPRELAHLRQKLSLARAQLSTPPISSTGAVPGLGGAALPGSTKPSLNDPDQSLMSPVRGSTKPSLHDPDQSLMSPMRGQGVSRTPNKGQLGSPCCSPTQTPSKHSPSKHTPCKQTPSRRIPVPQSPTMHGATADGYVVAMRLCICACSPCESECPSHMGPTPDIKATAHATVRILGTPGSVSKKIGPGDCLDVIEESPFCVPSSSKRLGKLHWDELGAGVIPASSPLRSITNTIQDVEVGSKQESKSQNFLPRARKAVDRAVGLHAPPAYASRLAAPKPSLPSRGVQGGVESPPGPDATGGTTKYTPIKVLEHGREAHTLGSPTASVTPSRRAGGGSARVRQAKGGPGQPGLGVSPSAVRQGGLKKLQAVERSQLLTSPTDHGHSGRRRCLQLGCPPPAARRQSLPDGGSKLEFGSPTKVGMANRRHSTAHGGVLAKGGLLGVDSPEFDPLTAASTGAGSPESPRSRGGAGRVGVGAGQVVVGGGGSGWFENRRPSLGFKHAGSSGGDLLESGAGEECADPWMADISDILVGHRRQAAQKQAPLPAAYAATASDAADGADAIDDHGATTAPSPAVAGMSPSRPHLLGAQTKAVAFGITDNMAATATAANTAPPGHAEFESNFEPSAAVGDTSFPLAEMPVPAQQAAQRKRQLIAYLSPSGPAHRQAGSDSASLAEPGEEHVTAKKARISTRDPVVHVVPAKAAVQQTSTPARRRVSTSGRGTGVLEGRPSPGPVASRSEAKPSQAKGRKVQTKPKCSTAEKARAGKGAKRAGGDGLDVMGDPGGEVYAGGADVPAEGAENSISNRLRARRALSISAAPPKYVADDLSDSSGDDGDWVTVHGGNDSMDMSDDDLEELDDYVEGESDGEKKKGRGGGRRASAPSARQVVTSDDEDEEGMEDEHEGVKKKGRGGGKKRAAGAVKGSKAVKSKRAAGAAVTAGGAGAGGGATGSGLATEESEAKKVKAAAAKAKRLAAVGPRPATSSILARKRALATAKARAPSRSQANGRLMNGMVGGFQGANFVGGGSSSGGGAGGGCALTLNPTASKAAAAAAAAIVAGGGSGAGGQVSKAGKSAGGIGLVVPQAGAGAVKGRKPAQRNNFVKYQKGGCRAKHSFG